MRYLLSVLGVFLLSVATIVEADEREFYQGRRLTIIVSFAPGGGYDAYTRLIARHLGKHIPGNPSVIVSNMPGAGSVIGANHLYERVPKDGTVLGTFAPSLILSEILAHPGISFKADRFNWLAAAIAGDVLACVVNADAGVRNLTDAIKRQRPLIIGATAPGTIITTAPRAYKQVLGANFQIVLGYQGSAGIRAAMARKEIDAGCWFWSSIKTTAKAELDAGSAIVFTQLGVNPAPDLPVENALERAKSADDRLVLTLAVAEGILGRPYVAPPEVPHARVAILRKAFALALTDRELLREAEKMGLDINPMPGEKAQNWVEQIKNSPPSVLAQYRDLLAK